jgi:hypothetical protein
MPQTQLTHACVTCARHGQRLQEARRRVLLSGAGVVRGCGQREGQGRAVEREQGDPQAEREREGDTAKERKKDLPTKIY